MSLRDALHDAFRIPAAEITDASVYLDRRRLILTGRLRRSYTLRLTPNGFEIVSSAPYAPRLQGVGRRTLPEPAEITARWDRALRERANAWAQREIG